MTVSDSERYSGYDFFNGFNGCQDYSLLVLEWKYKDFTTKFDCEHDKNLRNPPAIAAGDINTTIIDVEFKMLYVDAN